MTDAGDIERLLDYLSDTRLVAAPDRRWARNRLLEVLRIERYDPPEDPRHPEGALPLAKLLDPLLDDAVARGVLAPDTAANRERWAAAITGSVLPPPSVVADRFRRDLAADPVRATGRLHAAALASGYIRPSDPALRWIQPSRYGDLVITINQAKPERDPEDIAAERHAPAAAYPGCLLCAENEGYPGRPGRPARQHLRLVPFPAAGPGWFLQYSPYAYYPEHCIFLAGEHVPMRTTGATIAALLGIVAVLPHYFVGANADLPIVGGSILAHDHFQGGRFRFPIQDAAIRRHLGTVAGVDLAVLRWPLTTIRFTGTDSSAITALVVALADHWRGYDDARCAVVARTGEQRHNAITPVARRVGQGFEVDVMLRNNRTSAQHPLGIFHPHAEVHPVKRENIGLIEAMGLAVLPPRVAGVVSPLARAVRANASLPEELAEYEPLVGPLRGAELDDAGAAVRDAVGRLFLTGLEHCDVFAADPDGAMDRLLSGLRWPAG